MVTGLVTSVLQSVLSSLQPTYTNIHKITYIISGCRCIHVKLKLEGYQPSGYDALFGNKFGGCTCLQKHSTDIRNHVIGTAQTASCSEKGEKR